MNQSYQAAPSGGGGGDDVSTTLPFIPLADSLL